MKKMLRFQIWVTRWFIEHRNKIGVAGVVSVEVTAEIRSPCCPGRAAFGLIQFQISAYGVCMVAGPGGAVPVPRADTWGSRSELLLCPLHPSSSSPEEANPAVGRRRCGA